MAYNFGPTLPLAETDRERSDQLCVEVDDFLAEAANQTDMGHAESVAHLHDAAIGHQIMCRRVAFGRVDYDTAIQAVMDAAAEIGCPFPPELVLQFQKNHHQGTQGRGGTQ